MNKILSFICSHLRIVATTIYSLILIIIFLFPPLEWGGVFFVQHSLYLVLVTFMIIYVVCDIEADGPIPGPYSMISFGAVAVNQSGKNFGEFETNLLPLENASPHPVIMKWFNKHHPEALKYTQQNKILGIYTNHYNIEHKYLSESFILVNTIFTKKYTGLVQHPMIYTTHLMKP